MGALIDDRLLFPPGMDAIILLDAIVDLLQNQAVRDPRAETPHEKRVLHGEDKGVNAEGLKVPFGGNMTSTSTMPEVV